MSATRLPCRVVGGRVDLRRQRGRDGRQRVGRSFAADTVRRGIWRNWKEKVKARHKKKAQVNANAAEDAVRMRGRVTCLRLEPWGCMVALLRPETAQRGDEAKHTTTAESAHLKRCKPSFIWFTLNIPGHVSSRYLKKTVLGDESDNRCRKSGSLQVMLVTAHHSGVVVVGFDGQTGHRAVDPLLLLTAIAEPNPNHLLFHGELLGDERYLLRVGLRVLKSKKVWVSCPQRYSQVQLFMIIYCSFCVIQAVMNSNCTLLACSSLYFSNKRNNDLQGWREQTESDSPLFIGNTEIISCFSFKYVNFYSKVLWFFFWGCSLE